MGWAPGGGTMPRTYRAADPWTNRCSAQPPDTTGLPVKASPRTPGGQGSRLKMLKCCDHPLNSQGRNRRSLPILDISRRLVSKRLQISRPFPALQPVTVSWRLQIELNRIEVSLLTIPSTSRTSRRTRSKSARVAAVRCATISHLPLVECSWRSSGIPRKLCIALVVDCPSTSIIMIAQTPSVPTSSSALMVKPRTAPLSNSLSSRFCTVARDTPRSVASFDTGARPSSRRIAMSFRSSVSKVCISILLSAISKIPK